VSRRFEGGAAADQSGLWMSFRAVADWARAYARVLILETLECGRVHKYLDKSNRRPTVQSTNEGNQVRWDGDETVGDGGIMVNDRSSS